MRIGADRRSGIGRNPASGEAGFTLIEVLVAMALTALILGALSGALILMFRVPPETTNHLTSSNSAFQTSSIFNDDIQSAGPEAGQLAVRRNAFGCGGDPTSVLRVVTHSGADVEIRSYSVATSGDGDRLERRVCSGVDEAAALADATPAVRAVVRNLKVGSRPTVTCRATAVAATAPATPEGDIQCRLVSMTVETSSNLVFSVDGRRDTVQTPLASPTATKQSCTLGGAADTNVDSWYANAAPGTADIFRVQHKTGGIRLNGFIQVDLLTGCLDSGEPVLLPGGKQLVSATLSLTLLKDDWAGNDEFRLTTLHDQFNWNEDTLKYNDLGWCGDYPSGFTIPCENDPNSDPDLFYNFQVGSGSLPREINIPVLGTVQRWYDGTAINRGWTLDRGFGPGGGTDKATDGGWWFGSRENPNPNYRPKLILVWQ